LISLSNLAQFSFFTLVFRHLFSFLTTWFIHFLDFCQRFQHPIFHTLYALELNDLYIILLSCLCIRFWITSVKIIGFVRLSPLAIFTDLSEWNVFTVNLQSSVSFVFPIRYPTGTITNVSIHNEFLARILVRKVPTIKMGKGKQKLKNKLNFYFFYTHTHWPTHVGEKLWRGALRVFRVFPITATRTKKQPNFRIADFPISKRTEHANDFSQTEPRGKKIPHAVVRSLEMPNETRTPWFPSAAWKASDASDVDFMPTTPWRTREWLLCALRTRERKREPNMYLYLDNSDEPPPRGQGMQKEQPGILEIL